MMEYISLSEKAYSIYSVTDKEHDNVSKETRTHTHICKKKPKKLEVYKNFSLHQDLQIRFNFSCKKKTECFPSF